MSGRLLSSAVVVLLIISFGGIAAHAYLLDETAAEHRECPFCHWLQNLAEGEVPASVAAVATVIEPVSPEPVSASCDKAHRGPFSARSPPSA